MTVNDIKEKTTLDRNQLDILIRLDFFSEFGDMAKLMYIAMKYDQFAKRKTIKKNELEDFGVTEDIMHRFFLSFR